MEAEDMAFRAVENPKAASIKVYATFSQKAEVAQKAQDCNLSMSDYVLCCALGRQTLSRMDTHIINELRSLGEQQKALYYLSDGRHADKLQAILDAIVRAIDRIWTGGKQG
jgi:hypothetical protein